jgi:hypothetical protein
MPYHLCRYERAQALMHDNYEMHNATVLGNLTILASRILREHIDLPATTARVSKG